MIERLIFIMATLVFLTISVLALSISAEIDLNKKWDNIFKSIGRDDYV